MTNFKLAAVLFDMDGLMIDTEPLSKRAWQKAMSECGYTMPHDLYVTVIGRTVPSALATFQEAFGPEAPIDLIYKRKQQYMEEIMEREGIAVKLGLFELLDWLDGQHIPRAVASSTNRVLLTYKLKLAGLSERFEVIASGDEVQHGKPAPDIFKLAAERLSVSPANCVVLEDSEAGIKAAHAAGMLPLMVPDMIPASDECRQLTPYVLESLYKAKELLETFVTK